MSSRALAAPARDLAAGLKARYGTRRLKAVIFDVDGTLYHAPRLKRMLYLRLPLMLATGRVPLRDLRAVAVFRKHREELAREGAESVSRAQYQGPAQRLGLDPETVRGIIGKWMFTFPNRFMRKCRMPGISELLTFLRSRSIRTGVYSDYPARDKLEALGLDMDVSVSSDDPDVERLKPHPKGLLKTAEKLGAAPDECLFVGDRQDKDLVCARAAGMPCAILGAGRDLGRDFGFADYHHLTEALRIWLD